MYCVETNETKYQCNNYAHSNDNWWEELSELCFLTDVDVVFHIDIELALFTLTIIKFYPDSRTSPCTRIWTSSKLEIQKVRVIPTIFGVEFPRTTVDGLELGSSVEDWLLTEGTKLGASDGSELGSDDGWDEECWLLLAFPTAVLSVLLWIVELGASWFVWLVGASFTLKDLQTPIWVTWSASFSVGIEYRSWFKNKPVLSNAVHNLSVPH